MPCSLCKAADIQCTAVERKRLPRGRTAAAGAKNKASLTARVERLQSLVDCAVQPTTVRGAGQSASEATVAPEFWAMLAGEVAGIREAIDESDADEAQDDEQLDSELLGALPRMPFGHITGLPSLSASSLTERMENLLLGFYRDRVDTVLKTMHWPTAVAIIRERRDDLMIGLHSRQALKAALMFMGLCSARPEECERYFSSTKSTLVSDMQAQVEAQLVRAQVFQSPDLTGLQAFVTYLQAIRACGRFASSWMLLSIAVRMATALRLGEDGTRGGSRFDLEIRRRLWYSICHMDTQATLDRGSRPLIPMQDLGPAPLNIDDSVLSPASVPVASSAGLTDMSFALMTYEAMKCERHLSELENGSAHDSWLGWTQKQSILADFEQLYYNKYAHLRSGNATVLQHLLASAAERIVATMRLLLRRPPYRIKGIGPPPWDDLDVLASATHVLESDLNLQIDALSPWAWKRWVPWYALAVVLAELIRRPHNDMWERGFKAARNTFQRYAPPPTDCESGPLWRPIVKLLRRVQMLHSSHAASSNLVASVVGKMSQAVPMSAPIIEHQASMPQFLNYPETYPTGMRNYCSTKAAESLYAPSDSHFSTTMSNGQMQLSSDPVQCAFGAGYPIEADLAETLAPELGVSWLDWDLAMQDSWDESVGPFPEYVTQVPSTGDEFVPAWL